VSGDFLTILRSHGPRLAKRFGAGGGIESYDAARLFDLFEWPISNLDALAPVLHLLLTMPNCAVVRGAILDPARTVRVRRLLHADVETGEAATLREAPRTWLALDVEGVARPSAVPAADLNACYREVVRMLPASFAGARCVVQASGSHGIKPDIRLRLWFWCDRPVSGAELKRWLRGSPADPSVFGAAQLIYTAAPVFAAGARDPLPQRIIEVPGGEVVPVPDAEKLAPPVRHARSADTMQASSGSNACTALARAAYRILTADKRHPAIIRECQALAALVHAGQLSETDLRMTIERASMAAGKDDLTEIGSCITWALAHPSDRYVSGEAA